MVDGDCFDLWGIFVVSLAPPGNGAVFYVGDGVGGVGQGGGVSDSTHAAQLGNGFMVAVAALPP